MTFPIIKLPFDDILAFWAYLNMRRSNFSKDIWKHYFKTNAIAAGIDAVLFGVSYGIKEYMLGEVAKIIQPPAEHIQVKRLRLRR